MGTNSYKLDWSNEETDDLQSCRRNQKAVLRSIHRFEWNGMVKLGNWLLNSTVHCSVSAVTLFYSALCSVEAVILFFMLTCLQCTTE